MLRNSFVLSLLSVSVSHAIPMDHIHFKKSIALLIYNTMNGLESVT